MMTRFKPLLLGACLLAGLLSFGRADTASAQTANPEFANAAQSPPPAAGQTTQPAASANIGNPSALKGPEQRVALVIGNSNYQNAPQLPNPANDAQSVAQLLNSAGFEVIAATDLTQNDMIKVVQDFSAKIAGRGSNTVAMIYYAGHGVQLAGENYLIPVDAKVSSESDLVNNSIRLVDVMATLESIPSRMRIVVLDACRNNPFPNVNDATRGLAIVDAPNGSIVGYSTAPGTEALDGASNHSPYTSAFLHLAHQPNVPIEQLFKRMRLEVNDATNGRQTPWESSSLTSDFYFFGDTAVAATRTPAQGRMMQTASNLPSHSVRQMYDFVLAEGSPEYYQEFIHLFPSDPLTDRIRALLGNLVQAAAWHNAVLANSPLAYKAFHEKYADSPYALTALKLQSQPKIVPALQPTHLIVPPQLAPAIKPTNLGPSKDNLGLKLGQGGNLPTGISQTPSADPKKIVTLPAPVNVTPSTNSGAAGKIVTLPGGSLDKTVTNQELKANGPSNRIVDVPVRSQLPTGSHDIEVLKHNINPSQGGGLRGGPQPGKSSSITPVNSNARLAAIPQSHGPMPMEHRQGHGGFMR